ncbi:MAG: 2Fe-2S iron-sulfur cluster-binding protein [Candidatus Aminicenantes bacterium]|nr:2Fe-2S iron-sulfur cluster-binding protein [Candidatus Aminicenantes bacterium]
MADNQKNIKGISRREFFKEVREEAGETAVTAPIVKTASTCLTTQEGEVLQYKILNGQKITLEVDPQDILLDLLRKKLHLAATKRICNHGSCGGWTVLVEGKKVLTIEGLAEGEKLHPIQQAFIDHDGYQCGFCTPGFIMATLAWLHQKASPSLEEIKTGLSGNLCRCSNQLKILTTSKLWLFKKESGYEKSLS